MKDLLSLFARVRPERSRWLGADLIFCLKLSSAWILLASTCLSLKAVLLGYPLSRVEASLAQTRVSVPRVLSDSVFGRTRLGQNPPEAESR
jgi:hypothetical protein